MNNTHKPYETIAAEPMYLARRQEGADFSRLGNGTFLPLTTSVTAVAMNLRHDREGILEEAAPAMNVATLTREPVCTDTRHGNLIVFTQDAGGTLRAELKIREGEESELLLCEICQLPGRVVRATRSGSYLVLLLDDGTLHFLYFNSTTETYTSLGALPEGGGLSIEECSVASKESPIEEVTFNPPVADLRAGVPLKVVADTGNATRKAYERIFSDLRLTGRWVQPIAVRMGIRLKDGTLLSLTEPQVIDRAMQGRDRTGVQALYSESRGAWIQTSGTSAAAAEGYMLQVTADLSGYGAWLPMVDKVEIYVADEVDPFTSNLANVVFEQSSGKLLVTCAGMSASEHHTATLNSPWRLVATLSPTAGTTVIGRRLPIQFAEPDKEVARGESASSGKISVMTGHGEFLHYYDGEALHTSLRGNPLASAWSTQFSSQIHGIAAQTVGGGAYTRQYIYAFTNCGIFAVTHDYNGRHTNCRPIWPEGVTDGRRVVSTPWGVWCLTDCGTLLAIRDARCEDVLHCLAGCGALAWNSSTRELWLTPLESTGSGAWGCSLTIRADLAKGDRCPATMRSCEPGELLARDGKVIGYRRQGVVWRLVDAAPAHHNPGGGSRPETLWVSNPIETECRRLTDVDFGIYGEATDAVVSVALDSLFGTGGDDDEMLPADFQTFRLKSARCEGERRAPTVLRVLLPGGRAMIPTRRNRIVCYMHGAPGRFTGLRLHRITLRKGDKVVI